MTRSPRLTIAALIGLVALFAVTFAALRTSSPYWAAAMVSLTVLVLLGSVTASIWGRHRARWSGFAIFGWGYFVLAFCSPFREVVRPHLLTSVAIVESYRYVHPQVRLEPIDLAQLPAAGKPLSMVPHSISFLQHMPAPQFVAVAGGGPLPIIALNSYGSAVPAGPNLFYTFECSAHAAFTLAIAGLGGLFAAMVAHRAATTSQEEQAPRDSTIRTIIG